MLPWKFFASISSVMSSRIGSRDRKEKVDSLLSQDVVIESDADSSHRSTSAVSTFQVAIVRVGGGIYRIGGQVVRFFEVR